MIDCPRHPIWQALFLHLTASTVITTARTMPAISVECTLLVLANFCLVLIDFLTKQISSYRECLQKGVPRAVYDCPSEMAWQVSPIGKF